jgi:hypothetical protein
MMMRHFIACAAGLLLSAAAASAQTVTFDDFTAGEGHFTSGNTGSGSSAGFFKDATTTIEHDPAEGHNALGSQRLIINDDPAVVSAADTWRYRNLSGGGTIANNIPFASTGFVGYWLRTSTAGMRASILLDDFDGAVNTTERGEFIDIIADGQWHLYEWDLDDATRWAGFAGTGVNGEINAPTVTIDGIWTVRPGVVGDDFDATFWIDDVGHNPTGSLAVVPEPGSVVVLSLGVIGLLIRRRA